MSLLLYSPCHLGFCPWRKQRLGTLNLKPGEILDKRQDETVQGMIPGYQAYLTA